MMSNRSSQRSEPSLQKKVSMSYLKALPPVPKEFDFEEEEFENYEVNSPPPSRDAPKPPLKLSLKPTWPPVITENYTVLNSGRRAPPSLPQDVEEKLKEEIRKKKEIGYIDLEEERRRLGENQDVN